MEILATGVSNELKSERENRRKQNWLTENNASVRKMKKSSYTSKNA